jgi:hypothetical protein
MTGIGLEKFEYGCTIRGRSQDFQEILRVIYPRPVQAVLADLL